MMTGVSPTIYKPVAHRGVGPLTSALIMTLPLLFIFVLGLALLQLSQTQIIDGAAPDFTLNSFDGHTFTLSEQPGKVVIVNFGGSRCGRCQAKTSALN